MLQVEKKFHYISNALHRVPGEDFGVYVKSIQEAKEVMERCEKGEVPWTIDVLRALYMLEPDVNLIGLIENLGAESRVSSWDVWQHLMETYPETQWADALNAFTKNKFKVEGTFTQY